MNNLSDKSVRSQTETLVCVVTTYLPTVSATFIRGHIERLPTKTILVHSWPPSIGDEPVLSLPTRVAYKIRKRIARNGTMNETTAAYVKAFQRWRADVVLAEYGTTGVLVMDACRRLDIPLIVHFHG
ncbi:MAG TPA: glycosyltransferase, partial [Nitrososphaera sp.]|nr:glycosyltransferase [Nitrososphaera sp.]